MTDHERTFNRWKEDTRREALETELERLQKISDNQTRLIKNMRTKMLLLSIGAIIALLGLWTYMTYFPLENPDSKNLSQSTTIHKTTENQQNTTPAPENSTSPQKITIITPGPDNKEFYVPDDNIFFSIQIGAYQGVDLHKFRNNMVSLHQDSSAGINQFTLGIFPSYKEAAEFRDVVKKIGFIDAHIVATQRGHRIKVRDALKIRTTEQ
jgi:hypothetical protein